MGSITTFPTAPLGYTPTNTLGYAEVLVDQVLGSTFNAVTVTVPEGRRLKISAKCFAWSTVANDVPALDIKEGSTTLQITQVTLPLAGSGGNTSLYAEVVVSPSAGTHTYTMLVRRAGGTGTVTVSVGTTIPSFLLVEDITGLPSAAPPGSVPVGALGYAIASVNTDFGATLTDATGLSVNVVVPAGRLLRISAMAQVNNDGTAGGVLGTIREGSTELGRVYAGPIGVSESRMFSGFVIVSPSAGSHTYKLSGQKYAGAGVSTLLGSVPTIPAWIVVEDVTPTPAPASGAPSSMLGYAEVLSGQTGITTEADLTNLFVTITVPVGRRIRITGNVGLYSDVANDTGIIYLKEGASYLQFSRHTIDVAGRSSTVPPVTAVISPSAGTHTYKLSLAREAGSGTLQMVAGATSPSFILVEDITAVSMPPYTVAIQPTSQTLGYAEITATQTLGNILGETDVPGLSVTVTVPDGRRIRVSAVVHSRSAGATDILYNRLRVDGNNLGFSYMNESNTYPATGKLEAVHTPSAGTHTYKVAINRASGSGSVSIYGGVGETSYIIVEDITGGSPVVAPVSVPVGVIAQATRTTNYTTTSGTFTDIPGFSLNVAVPAGRLLKVNLSASVYSTVAGDSMTVRLFRDGVMIRAAADPDLEGNWTDSLHMEVLDSPSAGSHVYTAQINRGAGSGTVNLQGTSSDPALFWIEDVTPTPAPSTGAPGSTLAYAEVIANQGSITTEADLTGLSVTVTVPAGRRLKIVGECHLANATADAITVFRLHQDGVQVQSRTLAKASAGTDQIAHLECVLTPTAGTHTYKLRAWAVSGTVTMVAAVTVPAFILVEDITGSVWPTGAAVTTGMVASEAWTEWIPVFTQGVAVTFTRQRARYSKIGRQVTADFIITFTSTGTAGQGVILTLPVPAAVSNNFYPIGVASFYSAGTKYWLMAEIQSGGTVRFQYATGTTDAVLGVAAPFSGAVVSGQIMAGTITYEAAS